MKVKDAQAILDNLDRLDTGTQNRILKTALRNLVYHADNHGPVTSHDIAVFINAVADGQLG